jgi:glycosyltransferase involved in cell wall biosynthesis
MRIIVATSDVPFVEGGHLTIARALVRAFQENGHEAALLRTAQNRFGRQGRAYLANRFTDVTEDGFGRPIDQVVSLRFPSFALKHPRHVSWINHRLREYYDLWPMLKSQLGWKGHIKETARRLMFHRIDTHLLRHGVSKVYAQSKTIQERLRKWGNIPSEVLYPPPPHRLYRTDGYDRYIFTVSRLQSLKRIDLLIRAFNHVQNPGLKALIIGEGPEKKNLERLITDLGLGNRITLLGSASEEEVISRFAGCLAVYFAPLREDYGFVTGEAFSCRKAVITTIDSGGPAELVKDGESGYICPADPESLAARFDELAGRPDKAETMGQAGYEFISRLTWEKTVRTLLLP